MWSLLRVHFLLRILFLALRTECPTWLGYCTSSRPCSSRLLVERSLSPTFAVWAMRWPAVLSRRWHCMLLRSLCHSRFVSKTVGSMGVRLLTRTGGTTDRHRCWKDCVIAKDCCWDLTAHSKARELPQNVQDYWTVWNALEQKHKIVVPRFHSLFIVHDESIKSTISFHLSWPNAIAKKSPPYPDERPKLPVTLQVFPNAQCTIKCTAYYGIQ